MAVAVAETTSDECTTLSVAVTMAVTETISNELATSVAVAVSNCKWLASNLMANICDSNCS